MRISSRTLGEVSAQHLAPASSAKKDPENFHPICYYCKQKGVFRKVSDSAIKEGRVVKVTEIEGGKEVEVMYGICNVCAAEKE